MQLATPITRSPDRNQLSSYRMGSLDRCAVRCGDGVIAAFSVLISAIATSITRRKVTPIANPRAPDGTPLK